jgi:hypothetical protein
VVVVGMGRGMGCLGEEVDVRERIVEANPRRDI